MGANPSLARRAGVYVDPPVFATFTMADGKSAALSRSRLPSETWTGAKAGAKRSRSASRTYRPFLTESGLPIGRTSSWPPKAVAGGTARNKVSLDAGHRECPLWARGLRER